MLVISVFVERAKWGLFLQPESVDFRDAVAY